MRIAALMAALLAGGLPGAGQAASPEAQAYVAVDECVSQARSISDAVESRDKDSVLFNSENARLLCTRAASKLRNAKFDGVNTRMAAAGLDEIVASLEHLETALRLIDSNPAKARQEVKAAEALFEAGRQKLDAAS